MTDLDRDGLDSIVESIPKYGPANWERIADKHGVEFLGEGAHRSTLYDPDSVYVQGDYVIKINSLVGENWENKNEVENWERHKDEMGHLLVPIVDHAEDYSWIIMERAIPVDSLEAARIIGLEIAKEHGYDIETLHNKDVGIHDKRLKAFDYNFKLKEPGVDVSDTIEQVIQKWEDRREGSRP